MRDYLLKTFGAEDWRVVEQYKADSEKIREKLERLSGSITIFQVRVEICSTVRDTT